MAHCFVEFSVFGAIGDFECDEMTEEQIAETAQEIADKFVAAEVDWTIVENEEDYW